MYARRWASGSGPTAHWSPDPLHLGELLKNVNRYGGRSAAATLVVLAIALTAGCTSQASGNGSGPSAQPTITSEPSPSPSGLPSVSLATTCQLLFGSEVDGPMADAQDIILRVADDPDLSTITAAEVSDTIAGLGTARSSANDALVPFIDAQIQPLNEISTALATGSDANISFSDYKTSGLELITQCKPLL